MKRSCPVQPRHTVHHIFANRQTAYSKIAVPTLTIDDYRKIQKVTFPFYVYFLACLLQFYKYLASPPIQHLCCSVDLFKHAKALIYSLPLPFPSVHPAQVLRWTGSSVPSGQAPQLAEWGRIFVLKQLALISCAQQFPLSCCQLAVVHWVLCIWFLTKQAELQWKGKLFLFFLGSLTTSLASNVTVAFLALGCLADNLSICIHGNKWVRGKNNRFMPHCVFS